MIDIGEHGGKFGGGGGVLFKGELRSVPFGENIIENDLVYVGIDYKELPMPVGAEAWSRIRYVQISPDKKWALIVGSTGNTPHFNLFSVAYDVNGIPTFTMMSSPNDFNNFTSNDLSAFRNITFSNDSQLFIVFAGAKSRAFQLINDEWINIDFNFTGLQSYVKDAIFTPDDQYLIVSTGNSSTSQTGVTVARVNKSIATPWGFVVHVPYANSTSTWQYWGGAIEKPLFIDDRTFWISYGSYQHLVTLNNNGAEFTTEPFDVGASGAINSKITYLDSGRYMVKNKVGTRGMVLHRRKTNNFYEEVVNGVDPRDYADLRPIVSEQFSTELHGQSFLYGENGTEIEGGSRWRRYKLDTKKEKLIRIKSFEEFRAIDGSPYRLAGTNSSGKGHRILIDNGINKLIIEKDIVRKISNSTTHNYDFIGVAKQTGKKGDIKKVLLITD